MCVRQCFVRLCLGRRTAYQFQDEISRTLPDETVKKKHDCETEYRYTFIQRNVHDATIEQHPKEGSAEHCRRESKDDTSHRKLAISDNAVF